MKTTSDTLMVTFDSSLSDKSGICVSRVVNGKITLLKAELGEQADILYHLLTEQMTKAEIKEQAKTEKFPFFRSGSSNSRLKYWMEYAIVKSRLEIFDVVEKIKEAMYKLNTEGYLSDKQYDMIEKEVSYVYEQYKDTNK